MVALPRRFARSLVRRRRPGLGVLALLLLAPPRPASAQDGVIAGTVVAFRSLEPLEGVELQVAGTDSRTRTDARGRFVLDHLTGPQVTLELKRLGYRPLSETLRVGTRGIRLVLRDVAIPLDAIVVTGTPGGTEARAIGHDVGRIAAAQVLEMAPVVETQQLLSGRIPGLMVLPAQGNVGTGGLTQIRGVSSLSLSNEPLLYVDGVRVDNNPRAGPAIRDGRQVARINDLNPEDIENVEVIKGPSAATLYGTEASRGVIQIFTKGGSPGPPRWTLTLKQGANWFMNPEERLPWLYWRDTSQPLDPVTNRYPLDSLNLYVQEKERGQPIFRTGRPQAYGLGLSGGSEVIRYYFSGQYDRDEGVLSYNWRNRFTTRANLSVAASDRLEVRTSVGLFRNETRLGQAADGYGVMDQIVWGSPAKRDGDLRGFFRATPEAVATVDSRSNVDRLIAGVQLRHQPWSWLTQRVSAGTDFGDETSTQLYPRSPGVNPPDCFFGGPALCLGQKTTDRRQVLYNTVTYDVSANATLRPDLQSTLSLGAQYYAKLVTSSQLVCQGFPDPGVRDCGGAVSTQGSEDRVDNKTAGVYAQHQLGWKNRLFLTAALRADDNSAFGENFDFVMYPKLSGSWVVNEEPFWRSVPWVNALKLRAAWGQAGQQPDAFAAQRSFQPAPGGTLTPLNVGNPDLKPERAQEVELGFDAGLWNDRMALHVTRYWRRTSDAIVARQVAPSFGFPARQLDNLGLVKNWGTELGVDARVLDHRLLAWDLGLTLSTNASRIERLGGGLQAVLVRGVQEHREGYPVAAYFVRDVVSAAFDGDSLIMRCTGGPGNGAVPCDTLAPRVYLGQPTPKLEGSAWMTLTLSQRLRLNAQVDFKAGHLIQINAFDASHRSPGYNTRVIHDSSDALPFAMETLRNLLSDVRLPGLVKGGFAKLREVSVTYTLPDAWVRRLGASQVLVTLSGRNLATLWQAQRTEFGLKVMDPEIRRGDRDPELGGFVNVPFPQFAQFMAAVRITR